MDIEEIREYCLSLPGAEEYFPFGETTLVFKVMEKIFFLAGIESSPIEFNVKCDPEKAIELRENFPAVRPGYHMNKKHWNTVTVDGSVDDTFLREWIRDSYELVVRSLPAAKRKILR